MTNKSTKFKKKPAVGVPTGRNNTPIILGAAGLVVLLLIVAIVLTVTGGDKDKDSDTVEKFEYQAVTISGQPLPADNRSSDQKTADPALGLQAPDVSGKNFIGDKVEIKNDGKPKVIVFLAHWCPHCQNELPLLSDWYDSNKSKYENVGIYGIATATSNTKPNFPPSQWIEREGFKAPVLVDNRNSAAGQAFGIGSYPYFIALDANNKVIERTSGEIAMADFETLVAKAGATATKPGESATSTTQAPSQTTSSTVK